MKILTYYKETKELLKFISDNWPNHRVGVIKTILIDAKEELEEKIETTLTAKNLNLDV